LEDKETNLREKGMEDRRWMELTEDKDCEFIGERLVFWCY
jgi:hypothetical protein